MRGIGEDPDTVNFSDLIFLDLLPLLFVRIRIQEAKMLRVQRIRILSTSEIILFCLYQSIEAVTDDKRVLKHIMIDILNLRNGMKDNLLLIQQINLMIQKEEEEPKRFDDVIPAAQQHIDSINTVYTLGVSWLEDETDFVLKAIQGKIILL